MRSQPICGIFHIPSASEMQEVGPNNNECPVYTDRGYSTVNRI